MKKALVAVVFLFFAAVALTLLKRPAANRAPLPPPAPPAQSPLATPLAEAVQASLRDAASKARIEAMLAQGADPNSTDRDGRPVLILAVRNSDLMAMALLLGRGANINARDRDLQWTPLMHATFLAARDPAHLPALKLLLEKGADPNLAVSGTTALHVAVNNMDPVAKDAPAIEALLRAGAGPAGAAGAGTAGSPMMLAAWSGKTAAALALARGGADVGEGIRTARNNHHPELASALERLGKPQPAPGGAAKKSRPSR